MTCEPYLSIKSLLTVFLPLSNFDCQSRWVTLGEVGSGQNLGNEDTANPSIFKLSYQVADVVVDICWVRDGADVVATDGKGRCSLISLPFLILSFRFSSECRVCRSVVHLVEQIVGSRIVY